jgi:hypothetical protein
LVQSHELKSLFFSFFFVGGISITFIQ